MNPISLITYHLRYAKPSMTNEDNLVPLDTWNLKNQQGNSTASHIFWFYHTENKKEAKEQ